MKLFIKQKVFSWGDKFFVKNENGEDLFSVQGEVFTIGKKLHIYDLNGKELAFVKQKVVSLLQRYNIIIDDKPVAEVIKKISLLTQKYVVNGLDWEISGDFLAHEYSVFNKSGDEVMNVSKKWLAWGDTYVINTLDYTDPVIAIALVTVIDACLQTEIQMASANS